MRVSVKIASTVVLQRKKILASAEVDNVTSFQRIFYFFLVQIIWILDKHLLKVYEQSHRQTSYNSICNFCNN